jgi:Secretion system C-terminal sorting domain/SprB repeat
MKKIIQIIALILLPLGIVNGQERIAISNGQNIVLSGGTSGSPVYLMPGDPTPSGISSSGGNIISESEYNMVLWNIGTNTGTYVVPFGYSSTVSLPLSLNISSAGTGSGAMKFSTYHTPALNSSANPSDVGNETPFFLPGSPNNTDNSYNMADRFYIIDANTGYTSKPTLGNITFSYISGTANTEVGSPNTLTENHLMAQRYNSTTNTWNDFYTYAGTDIVASNIGTISTGPVSPANLFRSWSLWDNGAQLPLTISGTNAPSACVGGSATVTVYGGKSAYTYLWSPSGGNAATATNLSGGSYTVTVTDNNGIANTASVTITQPTVLLANASVIANVSCNAGNNGSAQSAPTAGSLPYTYLWSSGETTSSISGKTANTYTVTVHDSCGGSASATVSITQPYALTDGISGGRPETCIPGYATVSVTGGTGPYTYLWNPGSETSATASGLSAGVYTVTVTDAHGCATVPSPTLTTTIGYNPLRDSISAYTNNSCGQTMSGAATVGVKGGQTPYTYLWSNAGTTQRIIALSSGTYSVTVTDKNGCTATTSVTITTSAGLTVGVGSLSNISCYGAGNGSASISVSGGSSPYTYTWSPNVSTTSSAGGLAPASYVVSVKDRNGCYSEISFSITQPAVLAAVISAKTNVSCIAGSATVAASGGSLPYTYLWSPGAQTSAMASGLSAGMYTVAVTDAHGCSVSLSTTIGYTPLRDSISASTPNICGSAAIATVTIGVKGGTTPYTYLWSDAGSQTTATATGLSAGTYSVTVKDANGCSVPLVSTLIKDDILRDSISSITQNLCGNGSSAALTVGVKGGTTPYTYAWSNGATTQRITLLADGSYSVSVSDKNGCSVTATATITSPVVLTASLGSVTEVSCYGGSNGSASINVTGGVLPYTYTWSSNISTTSSATGLKCISYACTVRDHNGCSSQVTFSVTQPLNLVSTITDASCTLTAHTTGGTAPYTYLWSPGGQSAAAVAESNGTYTVTTTDNNGCSTTASHTVTGCPVASIEYSTDKKAPENSTDSILLESAHVTVYPNPSTGQFTIAGVDKDMIIEIYDYTGKIIRTVSATDNTMQLNIATQPNGIYLIRILSKNGTLIDQKKLVKTK